MTKRKVPATPARILASTEEGIPKYLEHLHNIHNQYELSQESVKNLDNETVVIKSDFSESWGTKYHTEVQSMHYGGSRMLLTLHTSIYYVLNPTSGKVESVKTCTVSEDVRHTAPAVFAHLKPLFQNFKDAGIKNVHIFTDGPTGQYKNKTSFYLIRRYAKLYGFNSITWHPDMEKVHTMELEPSPKEMPIKKYVKDLTYLMRIASFRHFRATVVNISKLLRRMLMKLKRPSLHL